MAINNQVTVTGTTGPASAVTSQVFNNVTDLDFDLRGQVLNLKGDNGNGTKNFSFDLYQIATVTYTISGHQATIAASN